MEFFLFFALIVLVTVLYFVVRSFVVVRQHTAYVVERMGKYTRTLDAGLHVILSPLDKIAYKHTLKEQGVDFPPSQCTTADGVTISVDGVVFMRVMDPAKASYAVGNYLFSVTQLVMTELRREVGSRTLAEVVERTRDMNGKVLSQVDRASDGWGLHITNVVVKNVTIPEDLRSALGKRFRAAKEAEAWRIESEAEYDSRIKRANSECARDEILARAELAREREKATADAELRVAEFKKFMDAKFEAVERMAMESAVDLKGNPTFLLDAWQRLSMTGGSHE